MNRLLLLLILSAVPAMAQNQSLSLPLRVPVHCAPEYNKPCSYPGVNAGMTGIIVARETTGTITDWLGDTWTRDQCVNFNGDCIYHTYFTDTNNSSDNIFFPQGQGNDVWMFLYAGTWSFSAGASNSYAGQANIPPDCVNLSGPVGDCPYNWTLPVAADAGDLLIAWSDNNATGSMLARPGLGWNMEASDGTFAVEDMIAPVEGPYIGAMTWKSPNGSDTGGSHWLMGLAAYRRVQ